MIAVVVFFLLAFSILRYSSRQNDVTTTIDKQRAGRPTREPGHVRIAFFHLTWDLSSVAARPELWR
jgi:hypothetical protein